MIKIVVFCLIWQYPPSSDTTLIWRSVCTRSVQVFVPDCSHNINAITWKMSVLVQQPWVLLHTLDTHYIPTNTILSGVAHMKALVPSIHYLQTLDKCNHSTIMLQHLNHTCFYSTWSTNYFYCSNTPHTWSKLHRLWSKILEYHYNNRCVEGRIFLIYFKWPAIMPLTEGSVYQHLWVGVIWICLDWVIALK